MDMRCMQALFTSTSVESLSASDPMERAADIFFCAALQAMAVRYDEIVESPTKNRVDAPPRRRLVPNAELDIQGDTAVLAQDARHVLYAAPNPRFAGGFMLLDEIRDDERLGGFVQKLDLIQNGMSINYAMINFTAPRSFNVVR